MRPAVRAAFVAFTEPLEGCVRHLYLDVKGLVTIGLGNLVDPRATAFGLDMVFPDGTKAEREDIAAAWDCVKARTDLCMRGGVIYGTIPGNEIRLTDEGLESLVQGKLAQVDGYLTRRFGDAYTDAPADAQLALLSLSWACGPAFRFPKLEAAVRAGHWGAAADEVDIRPAIGTIVHRNAHNRTLLRNADYVVAHGLDPDTLYWPKTLLAGRCVP